MHAAQQQQHRGTLQAGHTLVINKHTVQVERYLSQGGFAHVYVVRTSNPINNVTQHVLKRIAVPDAASLAGVRKEVDIMRVLRGHPNIVNFIDASWNALPNGTYEIFILMELCPGGGIIDMMNRRLRERLTEAEILQIFVDVCEAVACMHNLKPPLLHRDLKVENILQHSATRYKLCDFGSSTPVAPRPPHSSQEIRALEADLNKHTTLQYRAPEMVDVYLRRQVDEKSDVWALGVLLYKLCYYTTPFEEHGPLAILNVQYRIPPYPVYSPQMNSLIASMLRELGAQRPSIFEILDQVHRMRGTKSQFRYNIQAQSSLHPQAQVTQQSGLKDVLSFRTLPTPPSTSKSAAQARQTVLDAIAPMRRGRPTTASSAAASPSVPQQETELNIRKFEEQWNAIKAEASGNATAGWEVAGKEKKTTTKPGFGDNFGGFGDSVSAPKVEKTAALPSVTSRPRSNSKLEVKKDAFDGLGISRSREPSPTLGEVSERRSKAGANTSTKPPPLNAVSRTPVLPSMAVPLSPRIPASRTGLATYRSPTSLTVEERFPSLEELNKGWQPGQMSAISPPPAHAASQPDITDKFAIPSQEVVKASLPSMANTAGALRPSERKTYSTPLKGPLRSSEVTGKAMRDPLAENATIPSKTSPAPPSSPLDRADRRQMPIGSSPTKYRPSRPALARKHRSSMSIKYTEPRSPPDGLLQGDEFIIAKGRLDTPPVFSDSTTSIIPVLGSAMKSAVPGTSSNISQDTVIRGKHGFDLGEYSSPPTTSKREDILSQSPVRQLMDTVLPTQDSSSDDAEGPEDVNGHVLSDVRKQRAKGRQSSVHDLVDLYGGSGRGPAESERKGSSPIMGKIGRRTSGILVDISVPSPAPPQTALLSPATIVPESRAELASRRSGSSSREVSPPTGPSDSGERVSHLPSRVSPAMAAEEQRHEKPRPQSMFIFPSPQPAESSSVADTPGGARQRRSPRRGSISEMVDLYENLAGTKSKNPPAIAKKPTGLRLNKTPSPIATRFPPVSPTGASFSPTQVTGIKTNVSKVKPMPHRSPTADSYNVYSGQQQDDNNELVSRVTGKQSPSRTKTTSAPGKLAAVSATSPKSVKPPPLSIPKFSNKTVSTVGQRTPGVETPISAPSPERPYQGVGKLIDQWQRKSEEAEAARLSRSKSSGRPLGPRAAAAGRAR